MQHPSATALLRILYSLRWFAVGGQSLTIAWAVLGLDMALPTLALWSSVLLLAGFNLVVYVRLLQVRDATPAEAFVHVLVDTAVLTWLIAWTGGIANPFASLFLLPIALTAMALPQAWAIATATACVLGYLLAISFGQPLPHLHDHFDLHLVGMAVNFFLSVALVSWFLVRLAAARDRRERELASLRERFVRNEGILALATHAASVAHELNTPLGTMTLLLDDLDTSRLGADGADDVATLRRLVDTCRDRVRSLADPADPAATTLVGIDRVLEHWQLVRPAIVLARSGNVDAGQRVDRAIGHLLLALLNNAADASEGNGSQRDKSAAIRHVFRELAQNAGREDGTAKAHQHAACHAGHIAQALYADTHAFHNHGILAHGAHLHADLHLIQCDPAENYQQHGDIGRNGEGPYLSKGVAGAHAVKEGSVQCCS